MGKIVEAIKLSVEKEFLTTEMLSGVKSLIMGKIEESKLLSINASFNIESFSISVADIDDNEDTIGGKITPSLVETVITLINDVFKEKIDWDSLDLKSDIIDLELSLDFVEGKYIEKYDEANDKTLKMKYTVGNSESENENGLDEGIEKELEMEDVDEPLTETDIDPEDDTTTEISKDELEDKVPIMELGDDKSKITFYHKQMSDVLDGFKDFLDKNEHVYIQEEDGFLLNSEDLKWMENTLEGLKTLDIDYKIEKIEDDVIVDENVKPEQLAEKKIVAIDVLFSNKNEEAVVVFEEVDYDKIMSMLQGGEIQEDVEFEYIPLESNEIILEHGNRLYKDYWTNTKIQLINEKRVIL